LQTKKEAIEFLRLGIMWSQWDQDLSPCSLANNPID
jgi:hypothetical protein